MPKIYDLVVLWLILVLKDMLGFTTFEPSVHWMGMSPTSMDGSKEEEFHTIGLLGENYNTGILEVDNTGNV
ncbi:hypothetical protein PanWU01x14_149020 [Parasponia andersonii]|uniref:Uncharacterized protein n=1 Tax=Parasponia andersonii TaxID=3476 RepID=A0A2P5CIV3_PARAD|nr:hypothetical protein PanWU01x14_149020 [Parasponia andersonii]